MVKVKNVNIFQISECEGIDITLEDDRVVTLYFNNDHTFDLFNKANEYPYPFLVECMQGAFEYMMGKTEHKEDYGWEDK